MRSVRFILSKNPLTSAGGDVTVSRMVMRLASEAFSVKAVALGTPVSAPDADNGWLVSLPKQAPNLPLIALKSVRTGRSVIHQRFDQANLRRYLEDASDDLFVAEHTYMAESYVAARSDAERALLVNSHVSEAAVWALTRPAAVRVESKRIARDEDRLWNKARSVASFDRYDLSDRVDSEKLRWLDLTLKPIAQRTEVERNGPVAVFLGDRTWPPNELAAVELAQLWPQVSAGLSDAVLLIIGKRGASGIISGPQIEDLGFVDDLSATLRAARVMLAPIAAGGGVRVKVLDAAALGIPVVSTTVGFGSLIESLGVTPTDAHDAFIAEARKYLIDPTIAGRESRRLYDVNRGRWEAGVPQRSVARWLDG